MQLSLSGQLQKILSIGAELDAQELIAMTPASVQVCDATELAYFPRFVGLADVEAYDMDSPQRLLSEMADSLGIMFYDLWSALRSPTDNCPYQPHNMHFTSEGHRAGGVALSEIEARLLSTVSRSGGST
jgi:hypothetical protein